jgi:peptide deformylase
MSILGILKYPDPFLKTLAAPVGSVDESIGTLIDDMFETMYRYRGIGLAAVQVGVGRRVIVLDVPELDMAEDLDAAPDTPDEEPAERPRLVLSLVNPEIIESDGKITYEEGCLSVPGVNADVHRADHVKVTALNRDGSKIEMEATGLLSIVIQHEIDHLDGILFIDRLSRLKRELVKRKLKKQIETQEGAL